MDLITYTQRVTRECRRATGLQPEASHILACFECRLGILEAAARLTAHTEAA